MCIKQLYMRKSVKEGSEGRLGRAGWWWDVWTFWRGGGGRTGEGGLPPATCHTTPAHTHATC